MSSFGCLPFALPSRPWRGSAERRRCRTCQGPATGPRPGGSRWHAAAVLGCACVLVLPLWGCRERQAAQKPEGFTVQEGPLDIVITESGNLRAAESQSIKNTITRNARILELVDEGTTVTEEDVKNGKVLVKLDSTELQESLRQKESSAENAKASLTVADKALAIQKSENESALRTAALNVTYAVNDLRRIVGDKLADKYGDREPESITSLLDDPDLGGQTLQDLRSMQSDIELAKEECARAETKLKWSEQLSDRGFLTTNEKDGDALALRRCQLSADSSQVKLEIFRRYEFVTRFQKAWAAVLEAKEKLTREREMALSRLAQAEAKLSSAQAQHRLESDQLERLRKEVQACTIKAEKPGLVAFKQRQFWEQEGPLKIGTEVRPNQVIFELPDVTRMVVKVDIQESIIDAVKLDQTASIKVDAVPGQAFSGKVTKKAVLPSSQQNWLNPDLKVYETEITLAGTNESLRPGMTATVEVLAERLDKVTYVPIQAVGTDEKGSHSCYRLDGTRVPVTIGKRNQIFVVIESGLRPGETILMSPPEVASKG